MGLLSLDVKTKHESKKNQGSGRKELRPGLCERTGSGWREAGR